MTEERLGGEHARDPLWQALHRLPPGAGVVFRHYGWEEARRRRLWRRLLLYARARHILLVAAKLRGSAPQHLPAHMPPGVRGGGRIVTASAHSLRQAQRAVRAGAAGIFLSPVFPTTSHPGAPALGRLRFQLLAGRIGRPVVALGGMTPKRLRQLPRAAGFAAISWWLRGGRAAPASPAHPRETPAP